MATIFKSKANGDREIGEHAVRLAAVETAVNRMSITLDEVKTTVSSYRSCPMPGSCVPLIERVRKLEDGQLMAKSAGFGMGKVIGFVGAFCMGLALTVAAIVEVIRYANGK